MTDGIVPHTFGAPVQPLFSAAGPKMPCGSEVEIEY